MAKERFDLAGTLDIPSAKERKLINQKNEVILWKKLKKLRKTF